MTREEATQHIGEIRRDQFWLDDTTRQPGQNPLLGRLRRAMSQLATGIFEHAHHYIFELIQNADDNEYPAAAERFLRFVLLEDDPTSTPGSRGCLCVLNDESGFQRSHVESLCDIGNSTKHNREGYIGEKGIGFKSVFLISDRPHIHSNGYCFHFRRDDCDAGLGFIVPHFNECTPTVVEGNSTAILLPLRNISVVDVAKQLADIEPECILFLRRIRRIELVSAEHGLNRAVRCSGANGFVDLDAGATQSTYFVHRTQHSCAHIQEPLRQGVSSTCVTIALPLATPEAIDGRVFAFLPTEVRTGFPFLINGDFLLPASRERIFDTPDWNKQLVAFAAKTFVEAFEILLSDIQNRTAAYRFIPTKALVRGSQLSHPQSPISSVREIPFVRDLTPARTPEFIIRHIPYIGTREYSHTFLSRRNNETNNMPLITQNKINVTFAPKAERIEATFPLSPEFGQRGQSRAKARRLARRPRNIVTSVAFHSDECRCAVDMLKSPPLELLELGSNEPDEVPFKRTGYLMELDPRAHDWENDARVLMAHRVKFTVTVWSSLAGRKIDSLMTQSNYFYELGNDKRTAFFQPNDLFTMLPYAAS